MGQKIARIEDLQAWNEARQLSKMIYALCKNLPYDEKFSIVKHLLANARHVPANVAEGFGRFYLKDSIQFFRVAMGTLEEVKSDLYLCLDSHI